MDFEIKIKKPTFETIGPHTNKMMLVEGLNLKLRRSLSSNVLNDGRRYQLLMNVVWELIANKEIFDNDFDTFIKNTTWDDVIALLIGILNMSYTDNSRNIQLNFKCDGTVKKKNEDGVEEDSICGNEYKRSFNFNNLISGLSKHEVEYPEGSNLFNTIQYIDQPELGVGFEVAAPSIYNSLIILNLIEKFKDSKLKLWKTLNINENTRLSIIENLSMCASIVGIYQLNDKGERLLDDPKKHAKFNFEAKSNEELSNNIKYILLLLQFDDVLLNKIEDDWNKDESGLLCNTEVTCPKCGTKHSLDLKEWILDSFFP